MAQAKPNLSEADIARGHEVRDASPRAILIICFFASAVGVHFFAWAVLRWVEQGENLAATLVHPAHPLSAAMPATPPDPRLEPEPSRDVLPRQDLLEVQARERSLLNGHGWLDANHKFARIGLEQATEMAVERGVPLTLPAIGATTQQSTPLASSTHGPGGVP
jgi:hypothetical protein